MENLKIFGHQNPDLDSIASSMATKYLLEKRGIDAVSCRLGEYNKEVKYVLDYFNISLDMPVIENIEDGQEVVLVDHNEFTQSVNNIENVKIKMVIDHHKIDNFRTKEPIEYIAKPYGCNSTIIFYMLDELNALDRKDVNALMFSAIISDTLLLKSPTTTDADIKAANRLKDILGVNLEEYGFNLLKAGADLSDMSAEGLINIDSKLFEPNGIKVEIAQINAVDMESILSRQNEIEQAMQNKIAEKGLDLFMIAVTDVINCNSEMIVIGNRTDLFEKAFSVTLNNNRAFLEGVVSRKKQLSPKIMEVAG